jgi:hypothetical protein
MRTLKTALPAALVAGAVALVPAAASADSGSTRAPHTRAHAAGSDGGPATLPTAVRVRIKRGENALDRAADYVDQDMTAKATASLKNARRNMYAAWRSAAYIVENAPPPAPAGDGKLVAQASGAAPGGAGTTYATPEDTAMAVLTYQHDVVGASFGLLDGAKAPLTAEVSKTLFAALDRRDTAITWIHNRPAPPAPPADGKVVAHAAGAPVATGGFGSLMPGLVPDLDDELLQTRDLSKGGALTANEKRLVLLARDQIGQTEANVNAWWPPVPAAG